MSGINFEHIAQELLKQQQLMEKLDAENRELRRQLADLRDGRGIFIEIAGQRFPLEGEMLLPQPVTTSTGVQEDLPVTTSSLQEAPAPVIVENEPTVIESEEAATPVTANASFEAASADVPTMAISAVEEEEEKQKAPNFLEEIMIDEFAAAATSPLAVWGGPVPKQPPADDEAAEEEQKATLRRELMGSFLLE